MRESGYHPVMERRIFLGSLALVIALGAYLRLADLGGPSLWLDEILHLRVTQSLSLQPWYRLLTSVREVRKYAPLCLPALPPSGAYSRCQVLEPR